MIHIQINPACIEKVTFISGSDLEEDLDLAAWQLIRSLIDRVDVRLRKAAKGLTESARPTVEERVRR